MLRAGLLWLSEQPRIFRFIRGNGLARRFASRFVAGETVATGVAALKDLNAARISASLDVLGESGHTAAEAHAARDTYLEALEWLAAARANPTVPAQRGVAATCARCRERLLLTGNCAGLATRGVRISQPAKAFARCRGVARARCEFQMLYGVPRGLPVGLRREGYNVRVSVPFGTQ